jgi:hypothetical protein
VNSPNIYQAHRCLYSLPGMWIHPSIFHLECRVGLGDSLCKKRSICKWKSSSVYTELKQGLVTQWERFIHTWPVVTNNMEDIDSNVNDSKITLPKTQHSFITELLQFTSFLACLLRMLRMSYSHFHSLSPWVYSATTHLVSMSQYQCKKMQKSTMTEHLDYILL